MACSRSKPSARGRSWLRPSLAAVATSPPRRTCIAWNGLTNVLRHAGVLHGEVVARHKPATIIDGRDPRNYIFAPTSGIFEALVDPADSVQEGQLVARIYPLEHPQRQPESIYSPLAGVTACVRAISRCDQGDNLLGLGQSISADALS